MAGMAMTLVNIVAICLDVLIGVISSNRKISSSRVMRMAQN